jgi:hypothetical protein
MSVWRSKTVQCPAISHSLLRLAKCTAKLTPDAEQLDSLIGPCGLVLVISNQFAVPGLVLWVGYEKSK